MLLVLARVGDDFQGRAIRFSNESETRFKSLEELGRWLRRESTGGDTSLHRAPGKSERGPGPSSPDGTGR